MFRKLMAGLVLSIASIASFAQSVNVDTKGLSEAQVAEIKAIAAKKVAETAAQAANPTATPEKITAGVTLAATWGTQAAAAAEGFAKALGVAARELNVTVNDFLKSPAGILTAAVILWKILGATVIKMLYGVMFLTVGFTVLRIIYLRLFTARFEKVEYKRFGGLSSGTKLVRIPKNIGDLEDDGEWLAFWILIIGTIVLLAVGGVFF